MIFPRGRQPEDAIQPIAVRIGLPSTAKRKLAVGQHGGPLEDVAVEENAADGWEGLPASRPPARFLVAPPEEVGSQRVELLVGPRVAEPVCGHRAGTTQCRNVFTADDTPSTAGICQSENLPLPVQDLSQPPLAVSPRHRVPKLPSCNSRFRELVKMGCVQRQATPPK